MNNPPQSGLARAQILAEVLLFLTTQSPDVVSRTVVLGDQDVHDPDLLVAVERPPKIIVGQHRVDSHFALADFAEGLSRSHRVSLISRW